MVQCPYKHEMYKNANGTMTAGVYGETIIATGQTDITNLMDFATQVADDVGITGARQYNILEDGNGTKAVSLSHIQLTTAEMWDHLHKLYDQDIACMHCEMSRSMDEHHGQTPRKPEKVTLGKNQIIAYGSVVDLMTYEQAVEGITWYLEKTGDQGEAMLADIGYSGYEIVLRHVKIGDTHYAGDSDYVSVADAQRLVDAGLADYMQFA